MLSGWLGEGADDHMVPRRKKWEVMLCLIVGVMVMW